MKLWQIVCYGIEFLQVHSSLKNAITVLVDVQGFHLPKFIVKELTIYHNTWNFQIYKTIQGIRRKDKKQVRYLERYHYMLRFNDDLKDETFVNEILIEYLHQEWWSMCKEEIKNSIS